MKTEKISIFYPQLYTKLTLLTERPHYVCSSRIKNFPKIPGLACAKERNTGKKNYVGEVHSSYLPMISNIVQRPIKSGL